MNSVCVANAINESREIQIAVTPREISRCMMLRFPSLPHTGGLAQPNEDSSVPSFLSVHPYCEKQSDAKPLVLMSATVPPSWEPLLSRAMYSGFKTLRSCTARPNMKYEVIQSRNRDWLIYDDLPGSTDQVECLMNQFDSPLRPDVVAINETIKRIKIMEFTVPMETQIQHWHSTKPHKYESLCQTMEIQGYNLDFYALEIGCRGLLISAIDFGIKLPKFTRLI
jgi:hypothetical protein